MPQRDEPEVDPRFSAAAAALDEGDLERAVALARAGARAARQHGLRDLEADLRWLEGSALTELADPATALARLDEALALAPDHLDARLERAFALSELSRFDEARAQLEDVLARAPDEAWAHHQLGLLAERRGDQAEATRRFERARRLDPQAFPRPVSVSRAEFDGLVEAALLDIPEQVRRYLANVPITVEDLPSDDDLAGSEPPLSPTILGLFRGAPYGQKVSSDPWSHLPSAIVLYQRNLERAVGSRAELEEQIGVTLIHEVGHFLGLDEDELAARGLD
ncbi:MAG: metallopeptidase family protein [Anaeromyxobacter sp.]|nr:metallopeptidase family protein [Anaeromyxobacter sp.]